MFLEYAYLQLCEQILKSLHRLKLLDSDLSTGKRYPSLVAQHAGAYPRFS